MRGNDTSRQNMLSCADMPAGIGIAEQLLIAVEKEQAVEEGYRRTRRRPRPAQTKPTGCANCRIDPHGLLAGIVTGAIPVDIACPHHNRPHIYTLNPYWAVAPMLERSPVML